MDTDGEEAARLEAREHLENASAEAYTSHCDDPMCPTGAQRHDALHLY